MNEHPIPPLRSEARDSAESDPHLVQVQPHMTADDPYRHPPGQIPRAPDSTLDPGLIERLATQVGIRMFQFEPTLKPATMTQVHAFARLIAEECAKVCETADCFADDWSGMRRAAEAIREKFKP